MTDQAQEPTGDTAEETPPPKPTTPKRKRTARKAPADDFKANHRYHVDEKTTVETNHQLLGRIEATFYAGDVTPKSESEEVALQQLVDAGQATIKES